MRITGWHVEAFGALHDVGVRDLPRGLVVLHGPNAAGKSTLLAFLQRTLFGYPHRNRQDVNHYEPVGGGTRGGRVHLVDTREGDDAGEIVVERFARRAPRVIRPDGTVAGGAELDELVHGTDKRLFTAVFAFDLDDLSSIDSLTDEAVRDRLFSAGVRGAGRSARTVIEHLDGQARQVWTPRSRTQRLDRLQEELDEVTAELDAATRAAARYPERLAEEQRWSDELNTLDELRAELEAEEREADTLLRAWPVWQRRQTAEDELATLGDLPELDEDVLEQHEGLRAGLASAGERIDRIDEEQRALTEQLRACVVDDHLLDLAGEVADLDEERSAQYARLERLGALTAERRSVANEIDRSLSALGEHTTSAADAEPRASIATRGTLRDWEKRLAEARRALETAEQQQRERTRDRDHAARHVEEIDASLASLEEDGPLPPMERLERDRERLVQLRVALLQRDAAGHARTAAGSSGGAGPRVPLVPLIGGVAALLAVAGVVAAARDATALLGMLVGAAALLLVLAVLLRRRGGLLEPPAPEPEGPQPGAVLVDTINERARDLGLPEDPTFEDAEALALRLEQQGARRLRADQLAGARRQTTGLLADAEAALREATLARSEARYHLDALVGQWRAWCRDHDLDPELDPATVIDLLAEWERVADRRRQLTALDAEIAELRSDIAAFSSRAAALLAAASPGTDEAAHDAQGRPATTGGGDRDRLVQLRQLTTRVATARERAEERERLQARLAELEDERAREVERRRELEHARERLLSAAGAQDEAGLRATVERCRRQARLLDRIDDADRDLADRLGTGEASSALAAELASGDREAWLATRDRAHRERRELDAQRDGVLESLLEARQRREAVETSQRVAELQQWRQALLARRDDLVEEWQIASTARALVADTLESFERERQPAVLRRAARHLRQVTHGTYTGLLQHGDELLLQDAQQRTCSVDVLSRGTAEQLYMCLRLALAEDLSLRGQRLPFVMDDVLVNLDPERSRSLARLLGHVAEQNQILYFTCHPGMVELLQREASAVVYDLPREGGDPRPRAGRPAPAAERDDNPLETWWPS